MKIFEAGAALRALAKKDTPLGQKVKETIDAGNLVTAEIIMEIVEDFMNKTSPEQRLIFDGVPRTMEQKELFDLLMKKYGRTFRAMEFQVNREKTIQRLIKRAVIENRADDNEIAIKQRFQSFDEKTKPVIEAYTAENVIIKIDGSGTIEEVQNLVIDELDQIYQ